MAVDQFLKIDGIEGESRDEKHAKEIDVLAWSWGMSQSGYSHVGGGSGAGKVNVQDLSITKFVDKATPDIMMKCATGVHYKNAVLTVRKAGGTPLEYLVIKMDQVLIGSYSTGGSGGEDRVTENITLNFAKVEVTYTEQGDKGGAGATPKFGFDIAKNVKA